MDRRTHDRLPCFQAPMLQNEYSSPSVIGAGALGIVDIDGLRDAPVVADKLALNCRQDRVGVQTFAERNKINFSRHWSRTGALTGTELLGNCCGQQIHGQYAYHRKWPIEPPQSPHSYPRAANLGATPHTHNRASDPQRLTPTNCRACKTDALYCDARSYAVMGDGRQVIGRRYDAAWMIPRRARRNAAHLSENARWSR
jgi:hypothetical protein